MMAGPAFFVHGGNDRLQKAVRKEILRSSYEAGYVYYPQEPINLCLNVI